METIKLNELQNYLAWGLKCKVGTTIFTMNCINRDMVSENWSALQFDIRTIKPLVIPLTELTDEQWVEVFKAGCPEFKDIDSDYYIIRGKKRVTIEYKQWTSHIRLTFYFDNEFAITGRNSFNQLAAFTKLFSLHADVYDFVGRGIGLNKLTFNK